MSEVDQQYQKFMHGTGQSANPQMLADVKNLVDDLGAGSSTGQRRDTLVTLFAWKWDVTKGDVEDLLREAHA